MSKTDVYKQMDDRATEFEAMSDAIWEFAELAFHENRSAALQKAFLEKEGFDISSPVAGMNTAFVASYGQGKPVIAILGEYDALPGLSQVADDMQKNPLTDGGAGHGCGHNLLGTAGVEAACAIRKMIQAGEASGTIRYYGCPAEEGGCGKVYMIRAHLFEDVDAAVSFHPTPRNSFYKDSLAAVIAKFKFSGKAAHAASAPHLGRSALDAAELMNVGVQFLREHITPDCRIHYSFVDSGNRNANIVQDSSELLYCVRAEDNTNMRDAFERVVNVSMGAALMTGTEVSSPTIVAAYANIIRNETLEGVCKNAMDMLFPCPYTEEENAYAAAFNKAICGKELEYSTEFVNHSVRASTDFGDVSWVVPSVCVTTACYSPNTVMHSWPVTAQGKSGGAHKGMHLAAKIMVSCVLDLFADPNLLAQAKAEFASRMNGRTYASVIPENAKPMQ